MRKDRTVIRGVNNCQEQLLNPSVTTHQHPKLSKEGRGSNTRTKPMPRLYECRSWQLPLNLCPFLFHFCSLGASVIFCHNPISACWMLQQQCLTLRAGGCLRVGLLYLHNTSEMRPLFVLLIGKQFLMCSRTCKVEPR